MLMLLPWGRGRVRGPPIAPVKALRGEEHDPKRHALRGKLIIVWDCTHPPVDAPVLANSEKPMQIFGRTGSPSCAEHW